MTLVLTFQKPKALLANKKAKDRMNNVFDFIETDQYCPEIIQQIDSVISLLHSTKKHFIFGHLNHCLKERLHKDKDKTIA